MNNSTTRRPDNRTQPLFGREDPATTGTGRGRFRRAETRKTSVSGIAWRAEGRVPATMASDMAGVNSAL